MTRIIRLWAKSFMPPVRIESITPGCSFQLVCRARLRVSPTFLVNYLFQTNKVYTYPNTSMYCVFSISNCSKSAFFRGWKWWPTVFSDQRKHVGLRNEPLSLLGEFAWVFFLAIMFKNIRGRAHKAFSASREPLGDSHAGHCQFFMRPSRL